MYDIYYQADDKLPVYHSTVVNDDEAEQLRQSQQLAYSLALGASDNGKVTNLLGKVYVYNGGRYFLKLR